jgi:hypothetical protein
MKKIFLLFASIYLLCNCTYKNEEEEYFSTSKVNLESGLVAHYTFDNSLLDKSLKNTTGSLNGEAVYEEGKFDKALKLNGVDNYFTINAGNLQQVTVVMYFLGESELSSTQKPYLLSYGQDAINLNLDAVSGGTYFNVNGSTLNTPAENWISSFAGWNFLCLEISVADKTVKIICNSDKKNFTKPINSTLDNSVSLKDGNIIIGTDPNKTIENFFKGKIDDVRIYDRFLNDEEVQKLMNQ